MKLKTLLLYTLILAVSAITTSAQEALKPRPSPLAVTSIRYQDAYVKVVYSQVHKNGREIFGGLVPFGKIWRTGANEATEITLTHAILIGADTLKPGTYSLFTIPEKEQWTIIFNSELGLWGSYNYNSKKDVLRCNADAETNDELYEPFTIRFEQRNDKADMIFLWDRTKVVLPFKILVH